MRWGEPAFKLMSLSGLLSLGAEWPWVWMGEGERCATRDGGDHVTPSGHVK
jgi:hypothetical protein